MPRKSLTTIRELLETRAECDDEACLGWELFDTDRGLEIQRCDTCCPAGVTDADVRRLPLARRRLDLARAASRAVAMTKPQCPAGCGPLHLCQSYSLACLHCDVCGWGGDPTKASAGMKPHRGLVPVDRARPGDPANDDDLDEDGPDPEDEDEDTAYVRRVGELRAAVEGPVEAAIADATVHGQAGDPDHEVGDLQTLVRRLSAVMTEDQITRAMAGWEAWAS